MSISVVSAYTKTTQTNLFNNEMSFWRGELRKNVYSMYEQVYKHIVEPTLS